MSAGLGTLSSFLVLSWNLSACLHWGNQGGKFLAITCWLHITWTPGVYEVFRLSVLSSSSSLCAQHRGWNFRLCTHHHSGTRVTTGLLPLHLLHLHFPGALAWLLLKAKWDWNGPSVVSDRARAILVLKEHADLEVSSIGTSRVFT